MRTLVTIVVMAIVLSPVTASATIIDVPAGHPTTQWGIDQSGPGDTLWTRTYGGSRDDHGYSVQQTSDGGYIIAGATYSFGAGEDDVWLLKTDSSGRILWTRTYGGSQNDVGYSVQQTSDGGYIVTGWTGSFGAGGVDVWLLKTDSSGGTLWTRTYGGRQNDSGWSVQQTSDGGYVIAGITASFGAGNHDVYVVKTDSSGNTLWTRTYGGGSHDYGYSVQQTSDGGYIIAGATHSFGAGGRDVYLLKTDSSGNILWTRTYGGSDEDHGNSVQQTTDGGYIIAGYTYSFGAGALDVYLVKTDSSGDTLWTRSYGASEGDEGRSVQQTSDGGYIIAGYTYSFGAGSQDVWLLKADASGDTLWTRTYGESDEDLGLSVQQTSDGGYVIAGWTQSFGAGGYDVYLVKTVPSEVLFSPREFTFNLQLDTTAEKALSLECGSADTVFFSLRSDVDWITFSPDSGYLAPDSSLEVCVTFNSRGLPLGDNKATIFLNVVTWYSVLEYEIPTTVYIFSREYTYVSLIPDSLPIIIPPEGGRFSYWGLVYNSSELTYRFDIWIDATMPDGSTYGPIRSREFFRFRPHHLEGRYLTQNVPGEAPAGQYSYNFKMGVLPDQVDYQDSFNFTKLEAGSLPSAAKVTSWDLLGWEEEFVNYLGQGQNQAALIPTEYSLSQNYPNPFNATTTINYELPSASDVKLEVYNLMGEKVATLVNSEQQAGYRSVVWDASDISSGLYFYKLTAGDFTETRRMMLVK